MKTNINAFGGNYIKDSEAFKSGNGVCYVPDNSESDDEVYTRQDFIDLCDGDIIKAERLFDCLSWEFPETLLDQWDNMGDELDDQYPNEYLI